MLPSNNPVAYGRVPRISTVVSQGLALLLVLLGMPGIIIAQTISSPDTWIPISQNAKVATGRITLSSNEIRFQNGKSLSLAPGGQMLFRSDAKQKRVMATLYRITSPPDPTVQLCKDKPIAYLVVWRSETVGHEADRGLAAFSGPDLNPGSRDDCGHYLYAASQY